MKSGGPIEYRTPRTVLVADKSLITLTPPERGISWTDSINLMAPERQIHVVHPKRARLVRGLPQ